MGSTHHEKNQAFCKNPKSVNYFWGSMKDAEKYDLKVTIFLTMKIGV